MTQDAKAPPKITVKKPEYMHVPTPGNGTAPPSVEPTVTIREGTGARINIRPADEVTDASGRVVEAIQTVFRVARARIAYHEGELRKLHEALAMFSQIQQQPRQPVAPPGTDISASIDTLLRVAQGLEESQQ